MKLIMETAENFEVITEAKEDGKKNYYIEGVFLQSNKLNRNGRIYPKPILEREVKKYVEEKVNTNKAVGECGHPDGPSINLDRVSHKILSLKEDGDNYVGKALILGTPMGKIIQNLLEGGVQFGVSSRGLGTLKETKEGLIVQEDYHLATAADIVADPSANDAWVNGIMENVEYFYEGGRLIEKAAEEAKEEIEQAVVRKELSKKQMVRIFENYLNKLIK